MTHFTQALDKAIASGKITPCENQLKLPDKDVNLPQLIVAA
ncbi:hypothetical protein [Nostoc sp.]